MVCCLNPHCDNPLNPDDIKYCQSCGEAIVPLLLNRFKVIKVLGRGGFGKTYLAQDTHKLDESCVVKQLLPNTQGTWAKKKAIELFKLEAQQLQKLGEHPHIPYLYADFEQDGYFYLVQQFIKGQDLLKELEEDGVWTEEEVKEFLLELLPVLQFIHERRVIHRDIKLANIMRRRESLILNKSSSKVGKSGDLVLIDFGVSKQLSNTIVTTAEGTIIGSHGYAAMEQMQGGKAYPASDLFSLGATCVHLLTNIHPYQLFLEAGYGWTQHWRNSLPSQVSDQLAMVIDKLLQKDIEERYQSSQDVINDLQTSVVPSLSRPSKPKISAKSGEETLNLPESVELNPVPNQSKKTSTYSPFSGFFYLFALFGITALLAIVSQYVPWYVLTEIIIGAILVVGIVGVLQLKLMGVLSDESYVKVIQDILEKLSLVRSKKSSKETLEEETLDLLDNDQ